jgi:hypothetical protein
MINNNYNSDSEPNDSGVESESDSEREIDYSDDPNEVIKNKKDNIILLQSLSDQKLKLLQEYNPVDPLVIKSFYERLLKLEFQISGLLKLNLDIDSQLMESELNFLEVLNEYKQKIKNKEYINQDYIIYVNEVSEKLKLIRDSFVSNEPEPLENIVFDENESLESKLDALLELEYKNMITLAKQNKIPIPKEGNYTNSNEYTNAQNAFYNKMLKYIPIKEEIVTIVDKVKEEYKEYNKSRKIQKQIKNDSLEQLFENLIISKKIVDPVKEVSPYIYNLLNSKVNIKVKNENKNDELRLLSSRIISVWRLPIKNNNNYSFKTFDKFEDYLEALKEVILKNIVLIENSNSNNNITDKIINYKNIIINKDKLFEIDSYLNKNPKEVTKKQFYLLNNLKRTNTIRRFRKIITNSELVFNLEKYINTNSKNSEEYFEKVENIIFILGEYPEINKSFLEEKISIDYLFNIEKGIINPNEIPADILKWKSSNEQDQLLFNEKLMETINKIQNNRENTEKYLNELRIFKLTLSSERNKNKPNITIRKNTIQSFKNYLSKNLTFKHNGLLLKDIIINKESQKLELLIYDIAENSIVYNLIVQGISKLLNNLKSFSNNIVNKIISPEQLVVLFNKFKIQLNPKLVNVNYSDLSIKQIDAIMSQELNILKELNSDLLGIKNINKIGVFTINWIPNNKYFNKNEIETFYKIRSKTIKLIEINTIEENNRRNIIRLPPLSGNEYLFFTEKFSKELNDYKIKMYNNHKYKFDSDIVDIEKNISTVNKKILYLNSIREKKIKSLIVIQKKYKQKKSKIIPNVPVFMEIKYGILTTDLINQIILGYKRHLFNNNRYSELSSKLDYIDSLKNYNLISNEIYYQLYSHFFNNDKQFISNNNKFYEKALSTICEEILLITFQDLLNNISIVNNENILLLILKQWPTKYVETQNQVINTLLLDLIKYKDFSFYYSKSTKIIVQNQINKLLTNTVKRIESVIYDPIKKVYNTATGQLFKVSRFLKNEKSGLPQEEESTVEDKVARTGQTVFKVIKFPKYGPTPYISIRTFNKDYPEQIINEWKEVPNKYVKLYPLNYKINNFGSAGGGASSGGSVCPMAQISNAIANNKSMVNFYNSLGDAFSVSYHNTRG